MTLAGRVGMLERGAPQGAEGNTGSTPPSHVEMDTVVAEITARRVAEDAQKTAWLRQLTGASEGEIIRRLRDIDTAMQAETVRLAAMPNDAIRRLVLMVERNLFEAYGYSIAEACRCAAIADLFVAWGRSISKNEAFNLVRQTETDQRAAADLADRLVAAARSYIKRNPG